MREQVFDYKVSKSEIKWLCFFSLMPLIGLICFFAEFGDRILVISKATFYSLLLTSPLLFWLLHHIIIITWTGPKISISNGNFIYFGYFRKRTIPLNLITNLFIIDSSLYRCGPFGLLILELYNKEQEKKRMRFFDITGLEIDELEFKKHFPNFQNYKTNKWNILI